MATQPSRTRTRTQTAKLLLWSSAAAFGLGYLITVTFVDPRIALAIIPLIVIPLGARSTSMVKGALIAAAIGLVGSVSVMAALNTIIARGIAASELQAEAAARAKTQPVTSPASPASAPSVAEAPSRESQPAPIDIGQLLYWHRYVRHTGPWVVGATAAMCSGVALLFAWLARRRRRTIEREWQ